MKKTSYGELYILDQERIFKQTILILEEAFKKKKGKIKVALTGGSTPKAFYKWVTDNKLLSKELQENVIWGTSDERDVPLDSEESNFGNADRGMLTPLSIPDANKKPWETGVEKEKAVQEYLKNFNEGFDICFLGMGDDCHTASLFPGSALLTNKESKPFASIEVPGKGWRYTITREGLAKCGKIVICTTGEGKAEALKAVLEGEYDILKKPAQILRDLKDKTVWLVDKEAASKL